MRSFSSSMLASVAIAAIAAVPTAARAQVTISGAQTTPIATSTANGGTPADVGIATTGSITPASGTAVTIDSANSVTNAGTLSITDADNAIGILANPGVAGSITNSGTITVTESYTQTDGNGDGVVDGAFALGTGRYGIRTAGALTGDITNGGTITVHGNNSFGIGLGGTLTGSLTHSGTITVTGDGSVGIGTGAVTGNVALTGTIGATGAGASAVAIGGDVGGLVGVQGAITATGYTAIALPSSTTALTAANLLQGGPAVQIAGSVAGGVLVAAAVTSTNAGGTSTTTTAGTITSYGSGPALQIGAAARAITLGAVSIDTSGYGLEVAGTLTGSGVYDGYAAHALLIGGLGGAVAVAGGAGISGTVTATANDASSIAVEIGGGASIPVLAVTGTVSAAGATASGSTSTAILVDAGGAVPAITNGGTVKAGASSTATGTAAAIVDRSNSVATIANTGTITASGGASNVAIDLSADSIGAIVTQSPRTAGTPAITGDIRFGTGNDTLAIAAGSVTGAVSFGAGSNAMALSGSGSYAGTADFGGGAGTLVVGGTGAFTGAITSGGGLAVTLAGGTLNVTTTGVTALGSLGVTGSGTLGVTVNGSTGAYTQYQVAGTASFATGSQLAFHFSDLNHALGTYTVVTAGAIGGAPNLTVTQGTLPYLYKTTVATDPAATALSITVARKTATDLGFNRSQSAAYDAIYAAALGDKPVGDVLLTLDTNAALTDAVRALLPDHAGGTFETVSLASRATARFLADPDAPVQTAGRLDYWLQQVGWRRTKAVGDTAGYKLTGWGISGGAEINTGRLGRFGLSLAYLIGTNDDVGTSNAVTSNQYEIGAYWRADWGGLHAFARASGATTDFGSRRRFVGLDGTTQVVRGTAADWNGKTLSGTGGVSYRLQLGRFSLRPQAAIDYYRLHEDGYDETGGGAGVDLAVAGRTSDEFAATGVVALGYAVFDDTANDGGYLRAELEGGRREHVGGALGATTAHFAGGSDFTLVPDARTSGWTGALRLKGGNSGFTVSGEAGGEREQGRVAVALRAGVQLGF